MLRTANGFEDPMVRLYDSNSCKGSARVGVRPGVLFPHLIKTWEGMMPNGTTSLVYAHAGDSAQVLRMSYGAWEVLVMDAGGQELTVPDDSQTIMDHEPLLAVYFVARRKSAPPQATHHTLRREEAALQERLDGTSVVLPPVHSAGFTRVIQTQLTADFELIADPERIDT